MTSNVAPSFEILHLVSTLTLRFNSVFKKCRLDIEQLYVLAYIDSHGKSTSEGEKVLLRSMITKVLKEVFNCTDSKVSNWVNELLTQRFLGETTLDKDEKANLFSVREGRDKAVFIRRKGIAKLSFFIGELVKFRQEITTSNNRLLHPPGVDAHGPIASALAFFLSAYESPS